MHDVSQVSVRFEVPLNNLWRRSAIRSSLLTPYTLDAARLPRDRDNLLLLLPLMLLKSGSLPFLRIIAAELCGFR